MQNTFTVNGMPVPVIAAPQTPSWTVQDVAKYFCVTRYAVYKWINKGLLPVHRTPGGRLRFIESEVKAAQIKREGDDKH